METNSKIYIAGHNGLVGSAIHRRLLAKGYTNFVFTPFSEFDLTNQKQTADFMEKEKPEYVILAAAKVGGIVANNTYRAQFIYDNLQIQNNVIHYSHVYGVKKLLFLGSSCIYPRSCQQPMKESYLLTSELEYTNEPYAIAKIAGLKMCESYNIQYGTNFIAVMPTNLYGLNDNFDLEKSHVLPAIMRKLYLSHCLEKKDFEAIRNDFKRTPSSELNPASNETIIESLAKYGIIIENNEVAVYLWGTGKPRREFLHSDDLADACVFLMENIDFKDIIRVNNLPANEIRNAHLNIGTGKDVSISELALMIKALAGFEGQIKWDATKPDGTVQKLLDVSTLNALGWHEKHALADGVKAIYKQQFG